MLHLHDRHKPTQPLSEDQDVLLRRYHAGEPLQLHEKLRLNTLLSSWRDQRFWLACDCSSNEEFPLLSIRRTRDSVCLVRHGEIPHATICPFYRDMPVAERDPAMAEPRAMRPYTGSLIAAATPAQSGAKLVASATKVKARVAQASKLGRILATLLDEACVNSVTTSEITTGKDRQPRARDHRSQYEKLNTVWNKEVAEGLALGDLTCHYPSQLNRFLAGFSKLEARFPDHLRAQGYALFAVDDWEDMGPKATLHTHSQAGEHHYTVYGRVDQCGAEATQGPFLFLGQVGVAPASDRYEITRGYLQPVFSKTLLIPVGSGLERDALWALLDQTGYWYWRSQIEVVVHRPAFDEQLPTGDWYRPSFEVCLPNSKKVILDVLNSPEDPAYMARKAAMHEALSAQPNVVDVVRWMPQSEPAAIKKALTACVLQGMDLSAEKAGAA